MSKRQILETGRDVAHRARASFSFWTAPTCLVLAFSLLLSGLPSRLAAQDDPSLDPAGEAVGKSRALDRIATIREQRLQMAKSLTLAAPFYSIEQGSAELILLNRFSEPIDFELIARDPRGEPTSLGFHRAEPLRYLELSLAELLASGSQAPARGSLTVAFSGDKEMLQGWLVLERDRQVVEIPLDLVEGNTASRRYAFWDLSTLPTGFVVAPRFYLTNLGSQAMKIDLTMASAGVPLKRSLLLAPGAQESVVVRGRGWRSESGWLQIDVSGDSQSLVVTGLIEGEDFLSRLPIAGGAALGGPVDLQAVSFFLTSRGEHQPVYPRRVVASLYNADEEPIDATVDVLSTDGGLLASAELRLEGGAITSVDVGELLASRRPGLAPAEARLRIRSETGGLLAQGLIFDSTGSPVELEIARSQEAHYSGIYPLPSLAENSVVTTLVNLGEEATRVVAQIIWPGGEYALGPVEIAAGASYRLDLDALARNQKPDLLDRTFDPDYEQAFLQWTVQGPGSHQLIGRTQVRPRFGEDSFGFNCHGCCEETPWGELIPGNITFPAGGSHLFEACEYIGTCTTILGPYPASVTQLTYSSPLSWNGTTASAGGATSQIARFDGWGEGVEYDGYDCYPYPEPIFDDGPVCVINVQITETSLPNDRIKVKLEDGGAGKTGTLTVTLKTPNTKQVFSGTKGAGTHTIALNRDSLTTGHEYQIAEATWSVQGQSKTATRNFHFKVLGSYSNTRYNTPTESHCTGTNQTACYTQGTGGDPCVNSTGTYMTGTGLSGFLNEVDENGSGLSSTLGFVSREAFFTPPGTLTCHATDLRRVTTPCPACGGTLVANTHVAVSDSNANLDCGDRVYVSSVGERTVQDYGGGLTNTQLDHYNGTSGCNAAGGSIGSRKVFKLF